MKKRKQTAKIHPYTEESLKAKELQLKILISFLESLLLLPIINILVQHNRVDGNETILLVVSYLVLFLFFCLIKTKNKKYAFAEWEFLDDELPLIVNRKLDGEVSDFCVTKYILILAINIILVIPISLTFSVIMSSVTIFVLALVIKDVIIIDVLKFILIALLFKNFFGPINKLLIEYLKDKKELN